MIDVGSEQCYRLAALETHLSISDRLCTTLYKSRHKTPSPVSLSLSLSLCRIVLHRSIIVPVQTVALTGLTCVQNDNTGSAYTSHVSALLNRTFYLSVRTRPILVPLVLSHLDLLA